MQIEFQSTCATVGMMPAVSQDAIKIEPMVFSADWEFARNMGGAITNNFLARLPEEWRFDPSLVIDSRVHMLMPGWYPCIPGWHLDDVPRTRRDGQPDHVHPIYRAEHIICCVGDASLTSFLIGEITLEDAPDGELPVGGVCAETSIYDRWHRDIEHRLLVPEWNAPLRVIQARSGEMIRFGWGGFHKGNPATKNGWRYFIRASRHTQRLALNETRNQVQVYLAMPERFEKGKGLE